MSAIVWLLVGSLALLLLLALLAPVDLVVDARGRGTRVERSARVEWLYGLVRTRVGGREREERERTRPRRRAPNALAMLRTEGFPGALRRLAGRTRRAVHVRELRARVAFSLGDPAATGRAMGLVAPLLVLMPLPKDADVAVEPDFGEERLDADVHARARAWPVLVMGAFVAFFLTRATWRALRNARRA